jgi:hypothetical protein
VCVMKIVIVEISVKCMRGVVKLSKQSCHVCIHSFVYLTTLQACDMIMNFVGARQTRTREREK